MVASAASSVNVSVSTLALPGGGPKSIVTTGASLTLPLLSVAVTLRVVVAFGFTVSNGGLQLDFGFETRRKTICCGGDLF
jgi:hypothetical protein